VRACIASVYLLKFVLTSSRERRPSLFRQNVCFIRKNLQRLATVHYLHRNISLASSKGHGFVYLYPARFSRLLKLFFMWSDDSDPQKLQFSGITSLSGLYREAPLKRGAFLGVPTFGRKDNAKPMKSCSRNWTATTAKNVVIVINCIVWGIRKRTILKGYPFGKEKKNKKNPYICLRARVYIFIEDPLAYSGYSFSQFSLKNERRIDFNHWGSIQNYHICVILAATLTLQ